MFSVTFWTSNFMKLTNSRSASLPRLFDVPKFVSVRLDKTAASATGTKLKAEFGSNVGVGVSVGTAVGDGVLVGNDVAVAVAVGVGVWVGTAVDDGVGVGVVNSSPRYQGAI